MGHIFKRKFSKKSRIAANKNSGASIKGKAFVARLEKENGREKAKGS
jgi:hypothetical protein